MYTCHAIRMLVSSKGWCTTITSCGAISFRMTDDQFTTKPRNQLRANLKQQTRISSRVVQYCITYIYTHQNGGKQTTIQTTYPSPIGGTRNEGRYFCDQDTSLSQLASRLRPVTTPTYTMVEKYLPYTQLWEFLCVLRHAQMFQRKTAHHQLKDSDYAYDFIDECASFGRMILTFRWPSQPGTSLESTKFIWVRPAQKPWFRLSLDMFRPKHDQIWRSREVPAIHPHLQGLLAKFRRQFLGEIRHLGFGHLGSPKRPRTRRCRQQQIGGWSNETSSVFIIRGILTHTHTHEQQDRTWISMIYIYIYMIYIYIYVYIYIYIYNNYIYI